MNREFKSYEEYYDWKLALGSLRSYDEDKYNKQLINRCSKCNYFLPSHIYPNDCCFGCVCKEMEEKYEFKYYDKEFGELVKIYKCSECKHCFSVIANFNKQIHEIIMASGDRCHKMVCDDFKNWRLDT